MRALINIHRPLIFTSRPKYIPVRGLHTTASRWQGDYIRRVPYGSYDPAQGTTTEEGEQSVRRNQFMNNRLRHGDRDAAPNRPRALRPRNDLPKEEHLQTELKYLKDPYKLAEHVAYMLEKDGGEKALALVRLATKSNAVTVSWNHLIDYHMRKGATKKALDTYNEMKKRAQRPDSHTYLLLLRGLAHNIHAPGSLGKALSLYHAMSAPNSRVSPSIIHTNAVLKVCSRADDLESMWDIASKLPERGPHAANSWTYATIFHAIRQNALGSTAGGENSPETAKRKEMAIVEGRRLWSIVITRWREGDMMLDEELVNAVGRLLLIGSRPRDWDDVLSLIQQTMNIPRLVPRLGSVEREESGFKRIRAPHTPTDMKNDVSLIADEFDDPLPGSEFDSFKKIAIRPPRGGPQPTVSRRDAFAYARPGNKTLSLISEAGLKLIAKRGVTDYWELLTDPDTYAVKPDSDNMHMYLRVLRQARASAEALTFLSEDFPRHRIPLIPKSFRIAMSACVRDALNPNALATATRVLDLAQSSLRDPEFRTLAMYVEMASKSRDRSVVARALDRLQPGMVNVRSYLNFGPARGGATSAGSRDSEVRSDAVELMRKMIGCYDQVLRDDKEDRAASGGGGGGAFGGETDDDKSWRRLPDEVRKKFMERRSRLAAFVTREHEKQERGRERERREKSAQKGAEEEEKRRQELAENGEVDDVGESEADTVSDSTW